MKHITTRELTACAMIAALYTVLCLVNPLSFGPIQARIAEALTLLPVFSPMAILGVTLGCAVSNLVGFLSGANPLGYLDIFIGSGATLLAAFFTYRLRHVRWYGLPILSALPPVLFNAVIIGLELTVTFSGSLRLDQFLIYASQVAAGQLISCIALGLPFVYLLEKTGISSRCFPSGQKS